MIEIVQKIKAIDLTIDFFFFFQFNHSWTSEL